MLGFYNQANNQTSKVNASWRDGCKTVKICRLQEEKSNNFRRYYDASGVGLRDRRRLFRCQAAVSILPTQLSPRLALVFPSIVSTPDCLVLNSGKCSRQYQSVTVRRFHVHLEGSIRIR
uniref:Ovule protein n=1 Tax=Mesocestoides corti TaxID=53468 RepID=A0A5K3FXF6_MESCO